MITQDEIYNNIKLKFKELTGKDNYKVYDNIYFIPTLPIFKKQLAKAILTHNLKDLNKINEILLKHVRTCIKNKFPKYTRTIQYFIYGQSGKDCQLGSEYELYDSDLLNKEETANVEYKSIIK